MGGSMTKRHDSMYSVCLSSRPNPWPHESACCDLGVEGLKHSGGLVPSRQHSRASSTEVQMMACQSVRKKRPGLGRKELPMAVAVGC